MGLDISHDCFSGSYRTFHALRIALADAAGLPPLELMEGYLLRDEYTDEALVALVTVARQRGYPVPTLPIEWSDLSHDPLQVLLRANDVDTVIPHALCLPLSRRLMELTATLAACRPADGTATEGRATDDTGSGVGSPALPMFSPELALTFNVVRFATGIRAAHDAGEDVRFYG